MFEKEAQSYTKGCLKPLDWKCFDQHDAVVMYSAFKDGAECGYNKVNEYAKTIIQDLLNNSDEYARQRAIDFLRCQNEV